MNINIYYIDIDLLIIHVHLNVLLFLLDICKQARSAATQSRSRSVRDRIIYTGHAGTLYGISLISVSMHYDITRQWSA